MNINDLIEELKYVRSALFDVEDLLGADLNCLDNWKVEIDNVFQALHIVESLIVKLEAHSGPTE